VTPTILATCWTTAGDAAPLEGRRLSPLSLAERIKVAALAGFTGFGVSHTDLRAYLMSGRLADLRSIFDEYGITEIELEFLNDWWSDGETRAESDETLAFLRDAAEGLGARDVKVGADEQCLDFHLDRWAERFTKVCDVFAAVGTAVALEFTAFSNIPTVDRAAELVTTAGHPSGGLMLDIWHLERGGWSPSGLASVPLQYIVGVELDDGRAPANAEPYLDTINNRLLPGEGDFALELFIRTLVTIGFKGPWGVEIFSESHRKHDIAESLPKVFRATTETLALAGVC